MARHLRLTSILILTLLSFSMIFAQDGSIPVLKAKLGYTPDLSPQAEADWEKGRLIHEKVARGELAYEKLTPQEKRLYDCYHEEYESIWATQSLACSWYCGGGPYLVTASSFLAPQSGNTYGPGNIHDFSLKTAWVEGANGHGIGEYIEFFFEPLSPRVNKIEIMNGYVKSETAWRNNSRVKRLKFSISGKPYAILELSDCRSWQYFEIKPCQSTDKKRDMVFRFEILDVFPGHKYEDTAISEINFDGLDVHCFAKGTMVRMADGSDKPIEHVRIGDEVASYDFVTKSIATARVTGLAGARHDNLVSLKIGEVEIVSTDDHPYYVAGKGWCSLNPEKTIIYRNMDRVGTLRVGDTLIRVDADGKITNVIVEEIERLAQAEDTYTIIKLHRYDSFFANGILVGVEE